MKGQKIEIEFIKECSQYKAGDKVKFHDQLANELIAKGFAKEYKEPKKKKDK